MGREPDRRVEQHEPLDRAGRSRRELECEPATERMTHPEPRFVFERLGDRGEMRLDRPWWLVRRVSVADQVRCDDVEP